MKPDPYFDDPANQALIGIEKEVNLFNASVGIEMDNGLAVQVWARNLTNDEFITVAFRRWHEAKLDLELSRTSRARSASRCASR